MDNKGLKGTFALNKIEPIHRWYRYIEGYSSTLVEEELKRLNTTSINTIYDPFAGTGTTLLSASYQGIVPYYSETNPYMNLVVHTKINSVRRVAADPEKTNKLVAFCENVKKLKKQSIKRDINWDGFEKYYSMSNLSELLKIKKMILNESDLDVKNVLMVALSSVAVDASKMIRRGDLRFARENEKKEVPTKDLFIIKLSEVIEDIENYGNEVKEDVIPLASDCRDLTEEKLVDCVITSPPYLNGTNYIRNTKLELKLNDFVVTEKDLASFHSKGIVAGINNVSKRTIVDETSIYAQEYVEKLNECAYDSRIPIMVNAYFCDMDKVFNKLKRLIKPGGIFVMDIGDSQFAGVHIPTDRVLIKQCENNGFKLYEEQIIRKRYSKNGMQLCQKILRFALEK